MTRRTLAAAVATLAVAAGGTTAIAQSGDADAGPAGVPSSTAPFDQQFIDVMASHHAAAISMSRMAVEKAKSKKVRAIARSIIRAQTADTKKLADLRRKWYGSATFKKYDMSQRDMRMMGMSPTMDQDLEQAESFDEMFLTMMIPHHSGAITMAKWEMDSGEHAALKRVAEKEYSSHAREIGEMRKLLGSPAM